ncbi:MAG: 50S ribosomal protein L3 [Methanosarcinaceae archaeon]|nr:50S ribosomal protein L3 [Methanosarcinaceae archaeon]
MAKIHRPVRGSRGFSPRKRASSHIPRFNSWPQQEGQPKLQSFAGYKAGMTHVIMIDDAKKSLTAGAEISVPVTIIETPAIHVAAIRAYVKTPFGEEAGTEVWASNFQKELSRRLTVPKSDKQEERFSEIEALIESGNVTDIKVITYTSPKEVSALPKKVPDVMESGISGTDVSAKFEYAKSILGQSVSFSDIFKVGDVVDTAAITTGKGTQGPVKRWGIQKMKNKHSRQGSLRQIGNLGPRGVRRVFWITPQLGQTGYHQRTEYNKRILKIGTDGSEITPKGGIINYGEVSGDYILIKGSVPGPSKRLIRIRDPIRYKKAPLGEPKILHVNVQSQQG